MVSLMDPIALYLLGIVVLGELQTTCNKYKRLSTNEVFLGDDLVFHLLRGPESPPENRFQTLCSGPGIYSASVKTGYDLHVRTYLVHLTNTD
jgi:hypothetical protein